MTQRLIKNIATTFVPGDPGDPGHPGSPARAGYTYVEKQERCFWAPGNYLFTLELIEAQLRAGNYPVDGFGLEYTNGQYLCTTIPVTITVPGVAGSRGRPSRPATPSQTISDFQLGWTGRAHSISTMDNSGIFTFRVLPSAIGAVVGLSADPKGSGYGDILYGFYVARGITKIMEGGTEVLALGDRPGQTLGVRRTRGVIEYLVDGVVEYSRPSTPEPMVLSASLYSGGDEVVDPTFTAFGGGYAAGTFGPFIGFGAQGVFSRGVGRMERIAGTAYAYAHGGGEATLSALRGIGGIAYAHGEGALGALTSSGESLGAAPTLALAKGEAVTLLGAATGTSGGNASASVTMVGFAGLAGSGTGRGIGRGVMKSPTSTVYSTFATDEAFVTGLGQAPSNPIVAEAELLLVMNSTSEVVGVVAVSVEYLAALAAEATVVTEASVAMELETLIASLMRSSALLGNPADKEANDTWVYNVDVRGTTRYDRYDFNSFATIGGRHYGARADGVYELTGHDDAGVDVTVKVDFGDLSFGTLSRKALPMCYVGVASDGKLLLKVVADGQTHIYSTTDFDARLKAQRFILGRGLRASFYNVTLINEGGSAFALDSIQFMPVTLTRRQ